MPTPPDAAAFQDPKWEELLAWFLKECADKQPLWEMRIAQLRGMEGETRTEEEIAKVFADNSTADLQGLNNELASMMMRTSIIVAAATLMFAAFVVKGDTGEGTRIAVGTTLLAAALLMTAVAFMLALKALTPPIKRALKESYEKRKHWTLLVTDDFTRWVLNCWLADRRADVVTKYKKAHAIAVPLLVVAAVLTLPGLALVILG